MATFRAHIGLYSTWITSSVNLTVKANPMSPPGESWRVYSDEWDEWLATHPEHTIAVWKGGNDRFWRLLRKGERWVKVTPPNQGAPWWPQRSATDLAVLPEWAINALIELGEVA